MGLYDTLRSSYDLGEQFTNVSLQTKDIEDGIGGTMTDYWLDPVGRLWKPSYIGCHQMEEIPEDDERYESRYAFFNFDWVPTGIHGKYQPCEITKYIKVHLAEWKGTWESWPRLRLHFRNGVLKDYIDITQSQ